MVGLLNPAIAFGQNSSDRIKPQWMHRMPNPTNSTFIYTTVTSSSTSLESARKQTVDELLSEAGMKSGVSIISDYNSKEKVSQVWENGHLQETVTQDIENNIHSTSDKVTLHASKIDEYWFQDKSGLYHVYQLYAKSELGRMPLYDNVHFTTSYSSDPTTWCLSLVPGAAQIYKGSYLKGGVIMGGSVALVSGIIAFENMRSDNISKISLTHSADIKKAYNNKANDYEMLRNLCLGGFAAIYIYNIVDAFIAPGAKRIIVSPAATIDGQYGLTASFNF